MKNSIVLSILALCLFASCSKVEPQVYNGPFESVTLFYAAAYNNLSPDITGTTKGYESSDIQDLCQGEIPLKTDKRALLAFCHSTYKDSSSDFTTPNSPVLIRIYKDNDLPVLDTVKVYANTTISASESTLNSILNTVKKDYQSSHYGLVFNSHGTGWLPTQYYSSDQKPAPAPNSVGAQYDKSREYTYEIDIKAFANAIPMQLDYIIFDACLMGSVEVAYQLRNKVSKIVFSPTEIFTEGMYYKNMAKRLICAEPDLEGICRDYMEHYESGAAISLIDCSKLEALAKSVKVITDKYQSGIWAIPRTKVQRFYTGSHPWFYDMRDVLAKLVKDPSELKDLDAGLEKAVLYKNYTPEFGQNTSYYIKIERYSGMSMYLPFLSYKELNTYYQTLDWSKDSGLVK